MNTPALTIAAAINITTAVTITAMAIFPAGK